MGDLGRDQQHAPPRIASDIDVAALDGTRLQAFGLGTNKEIYESVTISQTWSGWSSFTPGLTFMHGTAASMPSEGRLWVFAIGADAGLWARYRNAGADWSDMERPGRELQLITGFDVAPDENLGCPPRGR